MLIIPYCGALDEQYHAGERGALPLIQSASARVTGHEDGLREGVRSREAVTEVTETKRRDFLRLATGVAGLAGVTAAVGGAALVVTWMEDAANDPGAIVEPDSVEVDLSPIEPGQQIIVFWRSWPVYIVRRSPQALTTLQQPTLLAQLADPHSQQVQQPSYAANWGRSVKPEFAVLIGICTHMGCMPQFYPQPSTREPEPEWLGGYLCPCHGSKYDLAGRVFKDVPAPYNLPVPPHRFVNDHTIRIGENPPNVKFDFGSILQI
jgi:ubiquinol-cytochrome c reductase iron-sulfur subunit